jgi:hypothetical protein
MTQALYAHINNKKKKIPTNECKFYFWPADGTVQINSIQAQKD